MKLNLLVSEYSDRPTCITTQPLEGKAKVRKRHAWNASCGLDLRDA
jgi:hypothetical protein